MSEGLTPPPSDASLSPAQPTAPPPPPVAEPAGAAVASLPPQPVITPAAPARPVVLGSRVARFGAQLIDGILLIVGLLILAAIIGSAGSVLVGILYLAALALYAPLLMARPGDFNGQTIGKQLVGLRVVHLDGGEMTFGRGFLREGVGRSLLNLFTFGLYGLIDSLWCLWDERKQTLHDKIGSTLVVTASSAR